MALLSFLSACAAGRTDRVYVSSSYAPEQYQSLNRRSQLPVAISGNPFPIEQSKFEEIVRQTIKAPTYSDSVFSHGIRLVFSGPTTTDRDHVCEAQGNSHEQRQGEQEGTIPLLAAFCDGGEAITYLVASISGISDPSDPKFQAFLRRSVAQLFPPPRRNDDDKEQDRCFVPGC